MQRIDRQGQFKNSNHVDFPNLTHDLQVRRIEGNDTAGTITVTTGSGVTAGSLADLVFSHQYGKSPRVIISGQDDASVSARVYPGAKSLSGFSLSTAQTLAPNTTYTFDYFIVE